MVKNMKYTKAKLPDICTIKTGKHDANHANKEGKYRFYTCSNQYSMCDTYSFTGESVIVPGNGDIGLVFYYDGEFDAYQRTYVLNDITILPKYLFYHMQLYWRNFNDQKKFGSTVKYVRMSNFTNYEISYPSIEEQERIVAKIEELFSDLDNAVETLNATKAQLKLYKQAVLKSAFSRCIELKKAEDLCFFITKGTTPKKAEFQLEDKSIPFIKVYNLTFDGSLDFTIEPTFIAKSIHETSLARSIVYPGDVLMNIVGPPMGKVSIVPSSYDEWNINQAIARFRCKEELNNRYLAYFLMSSETVEKMSKQTKATAGQFNLTLETCRNIDIPVCSINEQLRIVDNLDTQLTAYNNIEKTVNDALQQATAMRQSILKQAFEGRLLNGK
ncbi:restriction endonuclease subunit S [Streptococcus sp. 27098_8_69]|uniref:restriction endonuclease subunit S n=1 Tax=Streptococcus sp. 27098_8_69 TaxID=3003664 RepID=UPI00352FC181